MKKESNYIGNIQLGENVIVTDPCYKLGRTGTMSFNTFKPGTYKCSITLCDDGFYGNMTEQQLGVLGTVADLRVIHEETGADKCKWEVAKGSLLDVDSGTIGIYDLGYFKIILDESGKMKKENYSKIVQLTTRKLANERFIDKESFIKEHMQESYKTLLEIFKIEDEEKKRSILEKRCSAEIIYDMEWQRSEKELKLSYGSTIDKKGVVTATGMGDGCYRCYLSKNEINQIVGVRIKFI